MKIKVNDLSFCYDDRDVLKNINLEALPGTITALIGPNAAGKTTLLRCLAGILKPEGRIYLDKKEIRDYRKREINRLVSYLPQENSPHATLRVYETVLLGRLYSLSWRLSEDELSIAFEIMRELNIENLASQYLAELSGGQRQMVFIAQALVKKPKVLLLDEPTTSLDLQHQLEVLEQVRNITLQQKITTFMAIHDLNLAARYADRFLVLKEGGVYNFGRPVDVISEGMVQDIYGVHASIFIDGHGIPQVIPECSIRLTFNMRKEKVVDQKI